MFSNTPLNNPFQKFSATKTYSSAPTDVSFDFTRLHVTTLRNNLQQNSNLLADNMNVAFRETYIWTCRFTNRHTDKPLDAVANINLCYLLFTCFMLFLLFYVRIDQDSIVLYSASHIVAVFAVIFTSTLLTSLLQLFYRSVSLKTGCFIKNFEYIYYPGRNNRRIIQQQMSNNAKMMSQNASNVNCDEWSGSAAVDDEDEEDGSAVSDNGDSVG
ncbi:hypothetical protein HELRODRAFT_184721 [Helobdella robusta]|uniref:Uncharacterized protein n=1 Tax=Helobdella robusta TaxID=6412 RepID=T1FLV1_HELRO|nr:hypothetical protein HELRODRAFT_184721 [Helobdella robusta]ESO03502.1 hypothetical protein HELRODRAFT_184721 [Helobdella robusta]